MKDDNVDTDQEKQVLIDIVKPVNNPNHSFASNTNNNPN